MRPEVFGPPGLPASKNEPGGVFTTEATEGRAMTFRDRIRELRHVPAKDLRPNPKNWRTHPKAQADALRGVLAEIGLADACLARELPDGSLMLIDGHLRAETAVDSVLPVLVLDVTEEEADRLLLVFDPLSSMAGTDKQRLDELLRCVQTGSEAVAEMLEDLAADAGLYQAEGDTDSTLAGDDAEVVATCPRCGGAAEKLT